MKRHERRSRLRAFATISAAASIFAFAMPTTAAASEPDKPIDKAFCADNYRNAQIQRKNGALKRARESLLVCVSDRCPAVLQPDCTRWLTEVEAALPSIAFAAKGTDGNDVTTVRVTMDGQPLTDTIDGKSIPVDPGSHTLRFEHEGEEPIEQTIIVREGEKARVVTVSWAKTPAAGPSEAPDSRPRSGPPTAAWVLGGVGAGALATFGVLALHGMSRRSDLEKECFGSCRQEQVDSIKTELTIADVALGVGVVSLGVSAVLFLTSGGRSSPTEASPQREAQRPDFVSFGLAPHRDGAAASFSARF
ncbi:MAG: hypothetical protein BGO98_06095 [Myxococcales bacterium 68-20]|nr:hypothetical protein [Myxococcales bacterium]OJY26593.1 MAG: hypothetical protein BGO98_06095 [Myxococcales bacterium 68-20]